MLLEEVTEEEYQEAIKSLHALWYQTEPMTDAEKEQFESLMFVVDAFEAQFADKLRGAHPWLRHESKESYLPY